MCLSWNLRESCVFEDLWCPLLRLFSTPAPQFSIFNPVLCCWAIDVFNLFLLLLLRLVFVKQKRRLTRPQIKVSVRVPYCEIASVCSLIFLYPFGLPVLWSSVWCHNMYDTSLLHVCWKALLCIIESLSLYTCSHRFLI